MTTFATVDEYISSLPDETGAILEQVRQAIRRAAPAADERISYGIPTFTLDGRDLVYVAAWKRHIGLYPVSTADEALEREVAPYRAARSTVRFPLSRPIPYDLIERLVAFRIRQRFETGEGRS
jgi:uncharacterized protein YdhG (YjbR/CyaY superfamily)